MAQLIKKYAGGGPTESQVTSPPITYPTILVDGKEIELTEDLQNWIRQRANSVGGNAGYWVGEHLNSALTDGAKVDTGTHTIESNISYDTLNAAQQRRMGKLVRRSSKKLGEAKQGTYEFIEALRTYNPKKEAFDHSDELMFEYEVDDKGNYKVDENGNKILLNSSDTSNAFTRLLSLHDLLSRQDDFDFTGYNGQSLKNYKDWYKSYTPEGLKALESRLRTGTYTDADVAVLSDLGYTVGKVGTKKTSATSTEPGTIERYASTSSWNPSDWLEAGYAKKGEDGYLYLTDEGAKVFGTGNQWLNDSYLTYNPAAKSYVPSGKGLFIIDNRIYNADDAALRNQKTYIDFVNANKTFKYDDANNLIRQYHHNGSGPSYRNLVADSQTGKRLYSHALGYKDIYGRNSTNEYAPVYDANGKQLLVYEYFDRDVQNDPSLYDEFGHANASRLSTIAIDPETGKKVEVDPSAFKRSAVYKDYGIKGNIYSPYYQPAEGLNLIKPYGEVQGANWSYYYDPETAAYYYQSNEAWPDRSDKLSNEFENNPGQYLHRVSPEWSEFIKNNPEALKDPEVRKMLMYVLQNPYLDKKWNWTNKAYGIYDIYPSMPQHNFYSTRGIYRNGNVPDGYLYPITAQVPVQAQGGILKAQLGARMSAAEPVNLVAKEKVETAGLNKKVRAYGTEKVLGDKSELTAADVWDITALVADAAGIGLGYVPGAHLAGTGAGFLGSLAGFGADVKRDGFQWGDLGELGLNVGMDVGSIFAGSLAKTKKAAEVASGIKKLAPKLLTLVNLAGLGTGVQTAIESFQNDSWTIDDLRTVVNSFGSLRNLRRTVTPKTKTDVKDITLKHKTDSSLDVLLTKQDVDHINSLPEGQRAKALNDILATKTGQDAEIKKYQSAEKEFNALVEKNKAEAAKEGSGTKLWDEAEIAKTKKEFYESKGLDANKTIPTTTYAEYEGIDFRPDRAHWYSLSLPGKAPKIDIETTQKISLEADKEYKNAWDRVRQFIFRPALEVNSAAATLGDLGASSPRQAFANKPVEVAKPKEVVKPTPVEKPTEVPKVPQERVDYLTQLQAQRSSATAPKKPNILSLNEEDLRKAVDVAKTKKQRQQANSLLSDYLVAEAKYKREVEAFQKRQQKIDNEIATTQGQIDARKAYDEKVAEYNKYTKAQRKYDKYVKAMEKYEDSERTRKAYEAAHQLYKNRIVPVHLFVNEPYRAAPVYSKPQPGYYVHYKEGGKIQKGLKGLSIGQNPADNTGSKNLSWIDPVLMGAEFLNSQFATKKIGELNKKALQAQYESQLKTPFRENSPVRSNLASIQYSQLNDQLLKDRSRMVNTSDAGLNLARDLSIQEQANDLRTKGWNAIREEDLNYRNEARATALKNKLSEHEVGQNNYSVGKLIEYGKYSQDAFTNKQLKDNETALLAEIRNNIKSDRIRQAKYDLALKSQELGNIQQNMLNEFSRLSPKIKEKYSGYEDYWKQKYSTNYEQYQKDRLALKYDSSSAMNYPFLFNNKGDLFGSVHYSKSGGKTSSFNLSEKMILQNQKDNTKAFLRSKDNLIKILLKLMK